MLSNGMNVITPLVMAAILKDSNVFDVALRFFPPTRAQVINGEPCRAGKTSVRVLDIAPVGVGGRSARSSTARAITSSWGWCRSSTGTTCDR